MTTPINPAPPNLPLSPLSYDQLFQEKFSNVLRLFFNQVNSVLSTLITKSTVITNVYTVATLPAKPSAGDRTFVSDSSVTTFYSNVAGGGSATVPVYYNGTNWKVG